MSGELIDTTEMYLRTIYELHEEGIDPLRARIVERLGQSGPTVSQTVARLERDGLLEVRGNRHIVLSADGWERARAVMRRHRLAECMLSQMLGMDWSVLHDEACRLEHVMSDHMEERLKAVMGDPQITPYGTPIPGTDDAPDAFRTGVVRIADLLESQEAGVAAGELVRVSEIGQYDVETLEALRDAGIVPGVQIEAELDGNAVRLTGPLGKVSAAAEMASALWIAA